MAQRARGLRSDALRRLARSFQFRLLVTLVVTLAMLGVVQYQVMARTIEDRLLAEMLDSVHHQADALADAHRAHEDPMMGLMMVRAVTDGMVGDPATTEVLLIGPDGTVVIEAGAAVEESGHDGPHGPDALPVAGVVRQGAVVTSDDHAAYEFSVQVDLPSGTHVLHVGKDRSVVDGRLADARRQALLLLALGLPIGGAVFFLIGGRSLVRRHRRAVDGSARDPLTGLGNHRAFQEDLRRSLARADRVGERLACALVDIDNFKALNDQAGHSFGDKVLMKVAEELSGTRAGDAAYRIGGDEFAVLLDPATTEEAAVVMERVRRSIRSHLSNVTVSVGVADTEHAVADPDELFARADAALYEAKSRGRNRSVVFHDRLWKSQTVSPAEKRALERILDDGDVVAALQPIVDLDGHAPIGFEALARFPGDAVFQGPLDVFAVACRTGRVHELDALCRQAAYRAGRDLAPGSWLFVNIAPEVFSTGAALGPALLDEVTEAGLRPEQLVIEVTEQRIVDPGQLVDAMRSLRALGFKVALDDVGAGNAGLELLRLVDIDIVKIDQSVVAGAIENGPARNVLLAILAFAQGSGCYVIAEGIETDEILSFVNRVDLHTTVGDAPRIHFGQGFALGTPAVGDGQLVAAAPVVVS